MRDTLQHTMPLLTRVFWMHGSKDFLYEHVWHTLCACVHMYLCVCAHVCVCVCVCGVCMCVCFTCSRSSAPDLTDRGSELILGIAPHRHTQGMLGRGRLKGKTNHAPRPPPLPPMPAAGVLSSDPGRSSAQSISAMHSYHRWRVVK